MWQLLLESRLSLVLDFQPSLGSCPPATQISMTNRTAPGELLEMKVSLQNNLNLNHFHIHSFQQLQLSWIGAGRKIVFLALRNKTIPIS